MNRKVLTSNSSPEMFLHEPVSAEREHHLLHELDPRPDLVDARAELPLGLRVVCRALLARHGQLLKLVQQLVHLDRLQERERFRNLLHVRFRDRGGRRLFFA